MGAIVQYHLPESGRQEAGEEGKWKVVAGENVGCGAGDGIKLSDCLVYGVDSRISTKTSFLR
jgi:hypothetical protein